MIKDVTIADVLGPGGVISQRLPAYESRPQQIKLSEAILEAIRANQNLIAEAGTGTGKSMAYLLPALFTGRKVIVSTDAKALQEQLTKKDLPFLTEVLDLPASTFQMLKGIGNYVCLEAVHENEAMITQGSMFEPQGREDLTYWLDTTETGDLGDLDVPIPVEVRDAITTTTHDCTGSQCPWAERCHYLRAKKGAEEALVVVVNHALLAADITLRLKSDDDIAILPDRDAVILDEAHAFEEAATSAFTLELSVRDTAKLLRCRTSRSVALDPEHLQRAINATADLFHHFTDLGVGTHKLTTTVPMRMSALKASQAIAPLAQQVRASARHVENPHKAKAVERFAGRLAELAGHFIRVFEDGAYQDDYVLYVENSQRGKAQITSVVKWAPIGAGRILRAALWNRWPTIATSATMTTHGTFRYIRERLGVNAEAGEVLVGSPFKYKQNALIYFPRDGVRLDPSRGRDIGSDDYYRALTSQIKELIAATPGGVLVLFTSRKAMETVWEAGFPFDGRDYLYKQGDYPPATLIRRMKEHGNVVLFALRTFWTGIDVPGDALSLVILDKLPFPNPDDPVFAARCAKANAFYGDEWAWFNRLALPACVIQMKQGVGRLIRSQTDRGVIAVLDGRLGTKQYGTGIIRSMPPALQTRSIADVASFFKQTLPTQEGLI